MGELKAPFVTNVEDMSWIRRTSDCYFIIDETGKFYNGARSLERCLVFRLHKRSARPAVPLISSVILPGTASVKPLKVLSATQHMNNCNGSRRVFVQRGSVRVPFLKNIRASSYDKRLIWVTLEQAAIFSLMEKLTSQENKVLDLLSRGHTTQQIAIELHISYTTVRTHIRNLLSKLGVHNQKEAVSLFLPSCLNNN